MWSVSAQSRFWKPCSPDSPRKAGKTGEPLLDRINSTFVLEGMLLMKRLLILMLALSLGLCQVTASRAARTVTHRFLAQGNGKVMIVNTQGTVEWETPCPGVAHDIALLPNGNILFPTG